MQHSKSHQYRSILATLTGPGRIVNGVRVLWCRTTSPEARHTVGRVQAVTVGSWGVRGRNLKKELVGGIQVRGRGRRSATGIYLTKHSCHAFVCASVCLERGRKRERIMVPQAVWLIQIGENTTRLWLLQHTLTQTLCSSPPLPPSPSPLSTRASIQ